MLLTVELCGKSAQKLVIWELFVHEQSFPRGHMGGEIQFWIKEKNFLIPFPIVKTIHGAVSDVNGHFAILDKVVFLVSDYELLIFSGLFLVSLIITMFCAAKI